MEHSELLLKDEVYAIIGAAIEVHRTLGHGFLEAVYHEALEYELGKKSIPFQHKLEIEIRYKDIVLQKKYEADIVCFGQVLIELKACDGLIDKHTAQAINYLHATGLRVALLINFGSVGKLEWKRIVV